MCGWRGDVCRIEDCKVTIHKGIQMRNQCNDYHPLSRNLAVSGAGHYLCVIVCKVKVVDNSLWFFAFPVQRNITIFMRPLICALQSQPPVLTGNLLKGWKRMRDLPEQLHFVINVRKIDS